MEDAGASFIDAAADGQLDVVIASLQEYADGDNGFVDFADSSGETALMHACKGGHTAVAKHLIDAGCNIDAVSSSESDEWTALMYACYFGATDIVTLLATSGVDAAKTNAKGQTALSLEPCMGATAAEVTAAFVAGGGSATTTAAATGEDDDSGSGSGDVDIADAVAATNAAVEAAAAAAQAARVDVDDDDDVDDTVSDHSGGGGDAVTLGNNDDGDDNNDDDDHDDDDDGVAVAEAVAFAEDVEKIRQVGTAPERVKRLR
jgi:hypothetical protein